MFRYLIYVVGAFLAENLPAKVAYATSRFLFYMHYIFYFNDRRAVYNNLRQILGPDKNLYYPVKDAFRNFAIYIVEFLKMRKEITPEFIKSHIKSENLNYFDEVLSQGHGGIVITAHIGNWEMAAAAITLLGYPMHVVALPHKSKLVNNFFNRQRESKGLTVIQTDEAPRKCLKLLRENKLIGIVAERDFTLDGEIMEFLGRKMRIPRGPAYFAYKTNAPIIPAFILREKENQFILSINKPIYPPKDCGKEEAIKLLMRSYLSVIEDKIRKYPTQWLMFREYWVE